MPEPLKWASKTLLAKIETAYGTDAVPTALANAVLAMNVELTPMDGEDVTRNLERPHMGADPSIPINLRSVLSFDVELVGSGTLGTAPAWGPLLRMCGVAEVISAGTKVEYSPVTDGHEAGSIYLAIDTTRYVLLGARGTVVFTLNANGLPIMRYTLTGLFTMPSQQAKVVPDYTAWQAPQVVSKANTPVFTIGGTSFVMRNFSFDLSNDVQPRMLVGQEAILIVDKQEQLSVQVEAVPLTTYNPYQIAQDQTLQAINITQGTVAAKRVKLAIPSAQQGRVTALANEQKIKEWPLTFTPLPGALGNDQWKLTLE